MQLFRTALGKYDCLCPPGVDRLSSLAFIFTSASAEIPFHDLRGCIRQLQERVWWVIHDREAQYILSDNTMPNVMGAPVGHLRHRG